MFKVTNKNWFSVLIVVLNGFKDYINSIKTKFNAQLTFACSKSTIEIEKVVKYVHS